jgi:hypothetical protein
VPLTSLVGIGTAEESYNDAAVAIAFGTFKAEEDHTRELLGGDYYKDALKVIYSTHSQSESFSLSVCPALLLLPLHTWRAPHSSRWQAIADSAEMKAHQDQAAEALKGADAEKKLLATFAKGD